MIWLVPLVVLFVGLMAILLPIIAIIDILRYEFRTESIKIVWVIVIFFIPLMGSILYFVMGKNDKIQKA
ncbi:MAG: hypothetical protein CMO34_03550 [Verrucomicrobia bacterium]|nr:hypothetical protein [Verrucomicrobiota bacterium]